MKKLLTFVATLTLICALFLTGCVNQGMADKINEKAKSDEGYTYEQLLKDYKNPTIDFTATAFGVTSGSLVYVKGCKDANEVKTKTEAGEQLDAVFVIIVANVVTGAEFTQYSPDKKE